MDDKAQEDENLIDKLEKQKSEETLEQEKKDNQTTSNRNEALDGTLNIETTSSEEEDEEEEQEKNYGKLEEEDPGFSRKKSKTENFSKQKKNSTVIDKIVAESLEDAIKKTEQSNAGSPKKQMLTKRVTFMILEPPSSSERVFMINKIKKKQ